MQAPEATDVPPAPATPPPASGPSLRIRTAEGTAQDVTLPDSTALLPTHMALQFKVHGWVKGMEYHAKATLEWRIEGDRYHAQQSISAFLLGSLEQRSSGYLTAQGLVPEAFIDRRLAKTRSVHFDWPAQQAHFEPLRPSAAIGAGAQDRLSVFLQLAALLQHMPQLRTPGTQIEVPTLGSRSLQMWGFVVETEEVLDVPAGAIHSLRLRRLPKPDSDEHTQLWLDPARGYVPVRIHMQEANSDVMDLSLRP